MRSEMRTTTIPFSYSVALSVSMCITTLNNSGNNINNNINNNKNSGQIRCFFIYSHSIQLNRQRRLCLNNNGCEPKTENRQNTYTPTHSCIECGASEQQQNTHTPRFWFFFWYLIGSIVNYYAPRRLFHSRFTQLHRIWKAKRWKNVGLFLLLL